jgi:Fic family protein
MMINLPEDYINDLNIRMTHHSTAIEGNILTLDETRDLLLEGVTPTRSVNIREIHEVTSNARALKEVIKSLKNDEPFSEMLILHMHYFIGESTVTFPGEYKKVNNFIVGSDFETTPANQVAYVMNGWIEATREIFKLKDKQEFFKQLAKSHIEFEHIHPFSDGNARLTKVKRNVESLVETDSHNFSAKNEQYRSHDGRSGRMIMAYLALYAGHLPPVIPATEKKRYLDYLRKEDFDSFGAWLIELSEIESNRLKGFRGW